MDHRIIERFGSEGTPRGHLVQPANRSTAFLRQMQTLEGILLLLFPYSIERYEAYITEIYLTTFMSPFMSMLRDSAVRGGFHFLAQTPVKRTDAPKSLKISWTINSLMTYFLRLCYKISFFPCLFKSHLISLLPVKHKYLPK